MLNTIKSKENFQALTIALIYALCCKLFKCSYLQFVPRYDAFFTLISICATLFIISYIFRQRKSRSYSKYVAWLALLFLTTQLTGLLFHDQFGYDAMKALCFYTGPMMIVNFFYLQKNNISESTLIKAIIISCLLFCFAYIIGTITFPNQLFGFDEHIEKQNSIETSEGQRGVLRLFIYGSQIIPLSIYMILTYFSNNRKYYLLLVPLFVVLIMQGARTPFFVCLLLSIIYIISKIKKKLFAFFIAVILLICGKGLYEQMLKSTSDDVLTTYVQMTQKQVDNNKNEEDIRIEMARYMLFEFNGSNLLPIIFGNSFPDGKSEYSQQLKKLSFNRHYYTDDVGIVQIFVYMGIWGIIVYILVFYHGIKMNVPKRLAYGKLFLIHYALISFSNNAMVMYGMFTLGIAFYSIYRANYEMKLLNNSKDE